MLGLHVAPVVHLPLEGAPTDGAAERLDARVFAAVGDEVGRLAERLPAASTLIRLLSCNDRKVKGILVNCLISINDEFMKM